VAEVETSFEIEARTLWVGLIDPAFVLSYFFGCGWWPMAEPLVFSFG